MSRKKFSPPKSVQMAGHRVRVQVVEEIDDEGTWGHYVHDKKLIRIAKAALDKGEFRNTLRHEMTHAALRIGGVAFSDYMEEEAVVRCLDDVFFPAWEAIQHLIP
jgi:hypothetical protein